MLCFEPHTSSIEKPTYQQNKISDKLKDTKFRSPTIMQIPGYQQQQEDRLTDPLEISGSGYNMDYNTTSTHSEHFYNIKVSSSSDDTTITSSSSTDLPEMSSPSTSTSFSSSGSSSPSTATKPSIGVNLRVTGQCSQGGRKYMEDFFSVAYQQSDNSKDLEYAFIGIYDGHGGSEAATFAKEHLMMEIIDQKLFWSDSDEDVLRAIREGYIATHYAMWRNQENWPRTANGLLSTAGTTATIAFIRREKLYIGHVGDSGIVLGYQNEHEQRWRAKQLTTDHKPESLEERTRIMKSGGKVVVKSGVPRVVWNRPRNCSHTGPIRHNTAVDEIPFLAVARSLGDLWSYNSEHREFVVSPDPDVKVIKINPKTFRCLIFGTDGLWNVVTPQEAVDSVYMKGILNGSKAGDCQIAPPQQQQRQYTNPSKALVDMALKTWASKKMRADNTSVVTVILYPPNEKDAKMDAYKVAPPSSCGLEYTQKSTEIPSDDFNEVVATTSASRASKAASYREIAEKYLPPPEFRNFNYYDDYEDDMEVVQESFMQVETVASTRGVKSTSEVAYWCNSNSNSNNTTTGPPEAYSAASSCSSSYASNDSWAWNCLKPSEDDDDDDECDLDEDEEDDEEEEAEELECSVTNYANFLPESSLLKSTLESATSANSSTNMVVTSTCNPEEPAAGCGYLNSFAESYNSLLSEQIASNDDESSSSNSNPTHYRSLNDSNMNDLLQEQQLYQEQCMSEEEGYSLTKLETRLEQQGCTNGVQTFKIFQQQQQQLLQQQKHLSLADDFTAAVAALDSDAPNDGMHYWDPASPAYQHRSYSAQSAYTSTTTATVLAPTPQKPLELNSLLQQEREEEQQVAFERAEMQRKMAGGGIEGEYMSTEMQPLSSEPTEISITIEPVLNEDEVEESLVEEYLEEVEMPAVEDMEAVQIHQVSGNNVDNLSDVSTTVEVVVEPYSDNEMSTSSSDDSTTTRCIVVVPAAATDKTEIVPQKAPIVLNHQLSLRRRTVGTTAAGPAASMGRKLPRSHFMNVPNENKQKQKQQQQQRRSLTAKHTPAPPPILLNKRLNQLGYTTTSAATSTSQTTTATMRVGALEKRQLRSSNHLEYAAKRTLRSRNSLAKDLKAKSSLSSSTLKRPTTVGAATSYLLRNTLMEQQSKNNNTPQTNIYRKSEKILLNSGAPSAANSALNLRSRQVLPYQTRANAQTQTTTKRATVATSSTTTSTPPPQLIPLKRERRSLRSLTTSPTATTTATASRKSSAASVSSAIMPQTTTATNFGKSTRLQSSGPSALAPPPPSPKLLNAAAAVAAAATRARSLMTAKANNSVVRTVFKKRCSLRNTLASNTNVSLMVSGDPTATITNGSAASTVRSARLLAARKMKH